MKTIKKELSFEEQQRDKGWRAGYYAVRQEYKRHYFKNKTSFYIQAFIQSYKQFSARKELKALELDKAAEVKEIRVPNQQQLATGETPIYNQTNPSTIKLGKTKNSAPTVSSKPVVADKIEIKKSPQPIYKHSVKNTLFGTYVCESNALAQNQPEDRELYAFCNWLIQESL